MPKVLITDFGFPNVEPEREVFAQAGIELVTAQCKTEDDVIAAADGCDALLVQWAPVREKVAASLPDCKLVVRYGIGVDNLDIPALKAHGKAVAYVPDYCIDEVADHALALALSLARQLHQTHARTLSGTWKITPPAPMPAFRQMTFATMGYGRIARAILDRARPFGFTLAAFDPFVQPESMMAEGVQPIDLDDLFQRADILSLHAPLTAETKHIVNMDRLKSMKSTAIVINTARGPLIDTIALASALSQGLIGGAGIDVYEMEPLEAGHPLRSAPNTILTSHTAWYSEESVPALQRSGALEVVRGLTGHPLRNPL
jgi:D-3-phosphoglycerate dehydrogenase / 2-oxoglutarate reductase